MKAGDIVLRNGFQYVVIAYDPSDETVTVAGSTRWEPAWLFTRTNATVESREALRSRLVAAGVRGADVVFTARIA